MKKFLYKQSLIIVLILLLLSTITFATNEQQIELMAEKSEAFSQWENMSEDKRKNVIQPSYFDINLKNSIKRSTYNQYTLGNSISDESFNLADILKEKSPINVKNQQQTATCWAFSYSNVIETTLANKYNKSVKEYSPMHMDYSTGKIFNRKIGEGGSFLMALAYSANGLGPVYEEDFSFESVYDEENNSEESYYLTDINNVELNQITRARIEDATIFAPIYKSYSTDKVTYKDSNAWFGYNTYTEDEVQALRKLIKKHIKENGAISAVFYSDMGITANEEIVSQSGYYNSETNAYYSNNTIYSANHGVTIVGWDDNFKKENFTEGKQPLNDGAYIVLNSWGSEFGDNGYFYVSYDDSFIEQNLLGIVEVREKENGQEFYDNIYQYDELGANYALYSVNETQTKYLDSGYAANIFEREPKTKAEYLSEVGIYLLSAEGVEIYVNPSDDKIENCKLVGTYTGTNALGAGYHTLELASPIRLTGDKFVVKIKYINSENVTIPIECNLIDSGLSDKDTGYETATSNDDESFISYDGNKWNDLYNYEIQGVTLKNTSACIKAFTTLSDVELPTTIDVTGVTLDKESVTMKEGKTTNLVATVLPEDATNKNVTWTSDNEDIATVENGIVTGVAEGTATITVTTEEGNFKDTCKVTVEKIVTEDDKENETEKIAVTRVTLDKETVTIKEGKTTNLVATVLPENATNKNITWKSSNENVATVTNGTIKGLKEGTATITVTTKDGNFTDTCTVTVEKEKLIVDVSGVKLDKNVAKMQVGEKMNLVATIQPTNATNKDVTWTSSNEQVATISENGIIEALKEGKTTITVTTKDGKYTASCEITVSAKANTDDDIYTENQQKPNKTEQAGKTEQAEDSTIVKGELPKAGKEKIILFAVILILVTRIVYKKNNEYKDIK